MPIPQYEREIEEGAGPRFRRGFVMAFGIAALVGLLIGIGWVVAGLVYFHVLR